MAVPYTFGSATAAIPLSQLDSNFATTITLGNTAIQLGNTVTTLNNMTLANVTVQSGNVTIGQANAVVYTNSSNVATANATLIAFDGTNLGLGVTPSAWTFRKAMQLGLGASIVGGSSVASLVEVGANTYLNGSAQDIYIANGYATRYQQYNGNHYWQTAASGNAGTVITFTQSLAVGKGTSLALEGATSQTGTGITFPATQNASTNVKTLDDYEEGTWTPILGTDGSGVFTMTTQKGTYTKVGNLVSFSLYIVWSAYSGSGSVSLANWPFSIFWGTSAQRQYGLPVKSASTTAIQNNIFKNDTNGYVNNSYLYNYTDSSIVAGSTLGSTGWLTVSGQYWTT